MSAEYQTFYTIHATTAEGFTAQLNKFLDAGWTLMNPPSFFATQKFGSKASGYGYAHFDSETIRDFVAFLTRPKKSE